MEPALDPKVWASLQALEAAGAPGFLRELVSAFLAQAPVRMSALREASQKGDARALELEAHTLKGSCGSLGAAAMAACCDRLETLGRAGSPLGHGDALTTLEAEWQAVRTALLRALSRPDL
jgi:HPt (histidine-containing phosphotransfer) domain-containing protein